MHRRTLIAILAGSSVTALTGSSDDESTDAKDDSALESPTESTDSADSSRTDVRFELAPYEFSRCGTTCIEVTATLTNAGDARATGVHVTVQVVDDGDILWETDQPIGRLEAGASITRTERVDIGVGDALALGENGGRVIITTTVESDQGSERIEREKSL